MTRASFLRHLRPVHAVLLILTGAAIAIPLLSTPHPVDGTVAAKHAFVSSVRPVDRILAAEAPDPAPPAPPPSEPQSAAVEQAPRPPRIVLPAQLSGATADSAPDMREVILAMAPVQPRSAPPAPIPAPAAATAAPIPPVQVARIPEPRRKPARPVRQRTVTTIETKPLPMLLASTDTDLPRVTAPRTPQVQVPPPKTDPDAPRIALIVTAAGINETATRHAISALPGAVTLAFAPIGDRTSALAKAARRDGHTILVEIPMEPINPRRDPGEPLTLRTANTPEDNIARLDTALSRFPDASGISSYLGARFNRSEQAVSPVVKAIADRGLFIFENQPNGQSRLGALAKSQGAAYAVGRVAVDAERSDAGILERLSLLERTARREGVAIGVASAYRGSITALERWIAAAEARGIVFVPVTELDGTG